LGIIRKGTPKRRDKNRTELKRRERITTEGIRRELRRREDKIIRE